MGGYFSEVFNEAFSMQNDRIAPQNELPWQPTSSIGSSSQSDTSVAIGH